MMVKHSGPVKSAHGPWTSLASVDDTTPLTLERDTLASHYRIPTNLDSLTAPTP